MLHKIIILFYFAVRRLLKYRVNTPLASDFGNEKIFNWLSVIIYQI